MANVVTDSLKREFGGIKDEYNLIKEHMGETKAHVYAFKTGLLYFFGLSFVIEAILVILA